jgi:hypothetical protein
MVKFLKLLVSVSMRIKAMIVFTFCVIFVPTFALAWIFDFFSCSSYSFCSFVVFKFTTTTTYVSTYVSCSSLPFIITFKNKHTFDFFV